MQQLFENVEPPKMIAFAGWNLNNVKAFAKLYDMRLVDIVPLEPLGSGFTATIVRKAGVG